VTPAPETPQNDGQSRGRVLVVLIVLSIMSPSFGTWDNGLTLLLNGALGFGVQGIAVVESLLLARGVPLSVIIITLLFMSVVALPALVLAAVALGLSDVWLDYRKLEPASRADDE